MKFFRLTYYLLFSLCFLILPNLRVEAKENFTIVIDPGHGGKDAGAVDGNYKEKDINLGVALKLGEKIKKNLKNVNVIYTRNNDTFISLQGRAEKANKSKGNLFISIHTNSLDKNNKNRSSAAGSSVYVLGLHKDKENLAVAQRENSVIALEKGSGSAYGFDPNSDESYIIFEMAQKKNLSQSIKFANEVQKQLVNTAGRRDRGVHQAGFWVLWATSMPSVLVELDFICNKNSAVFMTSDKGQDKLAESIFNAVKGYISGSKVSKLSENSVSKKPEVKEEPEVAHLADASRSVSVNREIRSNSSQKRPTSTNGKRRRRSQTSKELSDQRDLEANNIILRSAPQESPLIASSNESSNIDNQQSNNVEEKISYKKVSKSKTESRPKGKHKAKIEKYKNFYAIQLLETEKEINPNDNIFCGFKPTQVLKVRDRYKYIYCESENLNDIESKLKNIKSKFPSATIIKNIRKVASK